MHYFTSHRRGRILFDHSTESELPVPKDGFSLIFVTIVWGIPHIFHLTWQPDGCQSKIWSNAGMKFTTYIQAIDQERVWVSKNFTQNDLGIYNTKPLREERTGVTHQSKFLSLIELTRSSMSWKGTGRVDIRSLRLYSLPYIQCQVRPELWEWKSYTFCCKWAQQLENLFWVNGRCPMPTLFRSPVLNTYTGIGHWINK